MGALFGAALVAGVAAGAVAQEGTSPGDLTPPDAAFFAHHLYEHHQRENQPPALTEDAAWVTHLRDHFEMEHADDMA